MIPFALIAKSAARRAARRAAFGLTAGLFLMVGSGFLLSALWLVLEEARGAIFASTLIGLSLAGLGLIFLAVALSRRRRPPTATEAMGEEMVDRLRRASQHGPGEVERAIHGLLAEAGLQAPPPGNSANAWPAMAAALVYGATLALSRKRRK